MHADGQIRKQALAQAKTWLQSEVDQRRAHMRAHVEVFEIEDMAHPAKKHQVEVLQPLELRAVERGLRARKVRMPYKAALHA